MPLHLSLIADTDEDDLRELTRQLCRDLRDEADLDAEFATQPAETNADYKTRGGEWEAIGQIAIKAVGTGGVLAFATKGLFDVLKIYAARKPSLEIKVERSKAKQTITIKATDIINNEAQVKALLADALRESE